MLVSLLTISVWADESGLAGSTDSVEVTRSRAIAVLREGLYGEDFWPSIHAAEGLTLAGHGSEVREYLEPRLADESDDRARAGIARELVRAGDLSQITVLTELLIANDPYSNVNAVESLYKVAQIGDQAAMSRASLDVSNPALQAFAAGTLAQHDVAGASQIVRTIYLKGEDRSSMRLGALVLGQIGSNDDIALLRSRIADAPDEFTLSYIQHALAQLGDAAGLEALVANLNSDQASIRTNAAAYAYLAGASTVASRLIEMLDDPHLDARYRAAHSLCALTTLEP